MNITLWKVDVTAAGADWWGSISVRQCHFFLLLGQLHRARFAYNTHPSNLRSDLKCLSVLHILPFCDSIRARDFIQCKVTISQTFVILKELQTLCGRPRWTLCQSWQEARPGDQAVGRALASNWRQGTNQPRPDCQLSTNLSSDYQTDSLIRKKQFAAFFVADKI